ncbi:hypothetical protein SprV_0401423400 [Sparganum proliferum]
MRNGSVRRRKPRKKSKKGPVDFARLVNDNPIPDYHPLTYKQFCEYLHSHKVGRHELFNVKLSTAVLEALTPGEIADLKALFDQQDANNDGLITLHQFKQSLTILNLSSENELQETLYRQYCLPGSLLDIDGFLSTVTKLQGTQHDIMDEIRAVFNRMLIGEDEDGLSLKDLTELCESMGLDYSSEELNEMFQAADTNNTGTVELDEFTSIMLKTNLFRDLAK